MNPAPPVMSIRLDIVRELCDLSAESRVDSGSVPRRPWIAAWGPAKVRAMLAWRLRRLPAKAILRTENLVHGGSK
jgi:hypothetical protein